MNKIEWDGKLRDSDLWKLFTDNPDEKSETVLFFSKLKLLLEPVKFEDETRYYHLYEHGALLGEQSKDAHLRATVTQRNLFRVASAMAARHRSVEVAIQYLGTSPAD
ncbi:MAG: hypothetical protein KUG70_14705 [Rhodobacteraceae bacterium]|nr:hypothetical protein [Paracoccaceae bacterium]